MQEEDEYIPVEEVAVLLGVTNRQAARYQTKVRTMKAGSRVLYHRGDVAEQAALKGRAEEASVAAQAYHEAKPPKTELMPTSAILDYLREKDAAMHEKDTTIERLNQQLIHAAHRIGELEAQLKQAEEQLNRFTDNQSKPWWKRLFER